VVTLIAGEVCPRVLFLGGSAEGRHDVEYMNGGVLPVTTVINGETYFRTILSLGTVETVVYCHTASKTRRNYDYSQAIKSILKKF
jgi:hypothetical protein